MQLDSGAWKLPREAGGDAREVSQRDGGDGRGQQPEDVPRAAGPRQDARRPDRRGHRTYDGTNAVFVAQMINY